MPHAPLQFSTIICDHCGAIIALVTRHAFRHTTHLTCEQCSYVKTIKVLDNKSREIYTEQDTFVPA
jgi:hypothetical protein